MMGESQGEDANTSQTQPSSKCNNLVGDLLPQAWIWSEISLLHWSFWQRVRIPSFLEEANLPVAHWVYWLMHDGRELLLTWALLVLADRVWCWKHDCVVSWRDLSFPIDKWWLYLLWTVMHPEEDLEAKQLTWVSCVMHWFTGRKKQSKYFLIFQVWMEGYCLPPTIELLIMECCLDR